MELHRRQMLQFAGATMAAPAIVAVARTQAYPTRPVRLIASLIAGGVDDLLVRLIGQSLSERLGQPVVIDNQPGTATSMGIEVIASAPPDGHSLALVIASNVFRAKFGEKLNFDFVRDIEPVAGISRNPFVLVVTASVPAKTVPEFIAYVKANPGMLNMTGPSISHLAGEQFKMMTGIDMAHVPYRGGGSSITALLNGQAQVIFTPVPSAIQHIKTGKVRALAVTASMRSEMLPDIPTVRDFVPGYEAGGFQGLCAPKSTPDEVISRLNSVVNAALADPTFKERLAEFGNTVLPGSPADFGKVIATETEKWARIIKVTNIKPE